jgi:beta-glucosidase
MQLLNAEFPCCSVGSILSGGGSVPAPQATPAMWVNMVNEFQKGALSTRLGIPMIYGIDAVHGNNNVYNATIFPHNVGLGATRHLSDNIHFTLCNCISICEITCLPCS